MKEKLSLGIIIMKKNMSKTVQSEDEKIANIIVKIFNSGEILLLKKIFPNDFDNLNLQHKEILKNLNQPKDDPRQMTFLF